MSTEQSKTPWTPGPWIFREWAQGPEDIARMKELGMEPNRMLMNDGACPVISADPESVSPRICLVDCKTPFKRGQGYLQECAERDANARLISKAPELAEALANVCRQYRNVRAAEGYPTEHSESILQAEALLQQIREGK